MNKADARFTRVQMVSAGARLTGPRLVALSQGHWYGRPAVACERVSDGRLFTVYPKGAAAGFLDSLEAQALERRAKVEARAMRGR